MRFLMVYLIASAGLRAQAPLSGEVGLEKFKQRLASLTKTAQMQENKTCAIPLLQAQVARASVDPKMVIVPRSDVHFHISQVIPPAPACEPANVLWKK